MTTTNSATIETGDNSEAIAIRLKTADGIERLAHVPLAWLNLRPPTADEQAQRVATDRQHEKWEREILARLLAKYGSPDAAEPSD